LIFWTIKRFKLLRVIRLLICCAITWKNYRFGIIRWLTLRIIYLLSRRLTYWFITWTNHWLVTKNRLFFINRIFFFHCIFICSELLLINSWRCTMRFWLISWFFKLYTFVLHNCCFLLLEVIHCWLGWQYVRRRYNIRRRWQNIWWW
jgi:hypothetical protein